MMAIDKTGIADAIEVVRSGGIVILLDDRSGQGFLACSATRVTAWHVNFMATHARGLICLALPAETIDKLNLPEIPRRHRRVSDWRYTVSIEASKGITTGISAKERAHTISVASSPSSSSQDVVSPGHVFPLRAAEGGLEECRGCTEASVALVELAGDVAASAICGIMDSNGDLATLLYLEALAERLDLNIVRISDIISVFQSPVQKTT